MSLRHLLVLLQLLSVLNAYNLALRDSFHHCYEKIDDYKIGDVEINTLVKLDEHEKLEDYDFRLYRCLASDDPASCSSIAEFKQISKEYPSCGDNCGLDDRALEWSGFFKIRHDKDHLQVKINLKQDHFDGGPALAFKVTMLPRDMSKRGNTTTFVKERFPLSDFVKCREQIPTTAEAEKTQQTEKTKADVKGAPELRASKAPSSVSKDVKMEKSLADDNGVPELEASKGQSLSVSKETKTGKDQAENNEEPELQVSKTATQDKPTGQSGQSRETSIFVVIMAVGSVVFVIITVTGITIFLVKRRARRRQEEQSIALEADENAQDGNRDGGVRPISVRA